LKQTTRERLLQESLKLRGETHRVVWQPLDDSKSAELSKIQAVGAATPLSSLGNDRLIRSVIDDICHDVLQEIDPLWNQLKSKLEGKYQLRHSLGEGSTSAVYLALDTSLEIQVAVRAVRDPNYEHEFDAAVRRAVQVGRHPAILTVFGAWLEKDPHYCVMEYVKGKTLRSHLEHPTFSWGARRVVQLLLRIGEALVETHARSIHLRDLRPSKILIEDNGHASICGLSKPDIAVGGALLQRVKNTGRKLTPEQAHYLVPEHFNLLSGPDSDEQSDQYLLGLVAYEIFTLALPPTLTNPAAVVEGETPQFKKLELGDTVPGCPRALSEAITRMTSINPHDRFPRLLDALDVLRDLQPVDLVLARESYARCTLTADREKLFFESFYATLRTACPEAGVRFKRFTPNRWRRLHGLLKEAVLLLFAYAAAPSSARGEPNVLSRIAAMHGGDGKLSLQAAWFDEFALAMVQTVCELDPECKDDRKRPLIEQAWQSSLEPGLRYMKTRCPTSGAQAPSPRAPPAGKTRVTKKKTARRDAGTRPGG